MKIKDYKKFCFSFDGVEKINPSEEDEEDLLAYTVMGEIFSITNDNNFDGIDLKCDPVKASMLRKLYNEVNPAQYKDKRQWNSVVPDGELDDELIKEWIKDSYQLVVDELPRKKQKKLEKLQDD